MWISSIVTYIEYTAWISPVVTWLSQSFMTLLLSFVTSISPHVYHCLSSCTKITISIKIASTYCNLWYCLIWPDTFVQARNNLWYKRPAQNNNYTYSLMRIISVHFLLLPIHASDLRSQIWCRRNSISSQNHGCEQCESVRLRSCPIPFSAWHLPWMYIVWTGGFLVKERCGFTNTQCTDFTIDKLSIQPLCIKLNPVPGATHGHCRHS